MVLFLTGGILPGGLMLMAESKAATRADIESGVNSKSSSSSGDFLVSIRSSFKAPRHPVGLADDGGGVSGSGEVV